VFRRLLADDVGDFSDREFVQSNQQRHRLPYDQLVRDRPTGKRQRQENDDDGNEITQGRVEVVEGDDLDQGRLKSGKEGSRSSDPLENYVSLDSRGDFELFWDVDSVTETIRFRLVANVRKDDLLAFGFSAYGEPEDADFCAMWTDLHGRHLFQVVSQSINQLINRIIGSWKNGAVRPNRKIKIPIYYINLTSLMNVSNGRDYL